MVRTPHHTRLKRPPSATTIAPIIIMKILPGPMIDAMKSPIWQITYSNEIFSLTYNTHKLNKNVFTQYILTDVSKLPQNLLFQTDDSSVQSFVAMDAVISHYLQCCSQNLLAKFVISTSALLAALNNIACDSDLGRMTPRQEQIENVGHRGRHPATALVEELVKAGRGKRKRVGSGTVLDLVTLLQKQSAQPAVLACIVTITAVIGQFVVSVKSQWQGR